MSSTSSMSDSYDCPLCPESWGSIQWLGRHMDSDHDVGLEEYQRANPDWEGGKSSVECANCATLLFRAPYEIEGKENHFCDQECKAQYGRTTEECLACGAPVTRPTNRLERSERTFCDKSCRGDWKSENQQGADNPMWGGGKSTVQCEFCGDNLERWLNQRPEQDRYFCDQSCQGKWISENRTGEDDPKWVPRETVECEVCGSELTRQRSELWRTEVHLCDDECRSKWVSQAYRGENNPIWKGGTSEVECTECGESIQRRTWHRPESDRYFCAQDCWADWMSDYLSGSNNPYWKGGDATYGPGWNEEKKESIRDRDDRRCQFCGLPESDQLEKIGCRLDVHHLIPARQFDADDPKMNHPSNLIAACRSCHNQWEGIPLRPQSAN